MCDLTTPAPSRGLDSRHAACWLNLFSKLSEGYIIFSSPAQHFPSAETQNMVADHSFSQRLKTEELHERLLLILKRFNRRFESLLGLDGPRPVVAIASLRTEHRAAFPPLC